MRGHDRDLRTGLKAWGAALLALALALRLIAAPIIMQAPAPGLMAICSGGQIIYISMQDGQPVDPDEGPDATSCPFFSVMSVLPGAEGPLPVPVLLTHRPVPQTEKAPLRAIRAVRDNHARAPPLRA